MGIIIGIAVFAVLMYLLGRRLRRAEHEGDYDPGGSSSVSRPGVRLFFDYGEKGWHRDGIRQRPEE
ncbi:MAG: hypothetical protein R3343_03700 [Nitriliruptorales bacterium]|nr:hypothetical protein [Nitriliruptorales bacterium]